MCIRYLVLWAGARLQGSCRSRWVVARHYRNVCHRSAARSLVAEKLAPGVIMESPAYAKGRRADGGSDGRGSGSGSGPSDDADGTDQIRLKRDGARGTAVLGVGMMFLGSGLGWGFAVGGALMTLGGSAAAIFWGRKLRARQEDPWDDAEIDAWEREQLESPSPPEETDER